jgi:hypothetical protein
VTPELKPSSEDAYLQNCSSEGYAVDLDLRRSVLDEVNSLYITVLITCPVSARRRVFLLAPSQPIIARSPPPIPSSTQAHLQAL